MHSFVRAALLLLLLTAAQGGLARAPRPIVLS